MRRLIVVPLVAFFVLSAHAVLAQEHQHDAAASPAAPAAYASRGTTVALHSTAGEGSGYLSLPASKEGKHPALIVIQEWWGLNDWIKEYSAEKGLVYLDYFSAMVDERGFLKRELSEDGLHPNKAGYAVMAPLAENAIQLALKM